MRFGSRTYAVYGVVSMVAVTGRRVDMDPLVGAAEIADRLGVSNSQVIHVWRGRHADFPEPITQLRTAMIWHWPDVQKGAVRTGRLVRQPHT